MIFTWFGQDAYVHGDIYSSLYDKVNDTQSDIALALTLEPKLLTLLHHSPSLLSIL